METENPTRPTIRESQQGLHTVLQRGQFEHVVLTREALQAVVQYAYDVHGILASPSYDTEAERAPEPASSGACPCGLEGCSDRPAYVAEYRTGLQVGAL